MSSEGATIWAPSLSNPQLLATLDPGLRAKPRVLLFLGVDPARPSLHLCPRTHGPCAGRAGGAPVPPLGSKHRIGVVSDETRHTRGVRNGYRAVRCSYQYLC